MKPEARKFDLCRGGRGLRVVAFLWAFVLTAVLMGGRAQAQQYNWQNFAGMRGGIGIADGTGSTAQFNNPQGATMDDNGNVYIADTASHTIRKVTAAGVVTTLAGSPGVSGTADGTGSAARFNSPRSVAVDLSGNVYVADYENSMIRKVTAAGVVTTLAGSPGVSGTADGTGSAARFNSPQGVAVDLSGNVYIADTANHTIRKVTAAGVVTTLAGSPGISGTANGTGSAARFYLPGGVAVDSGSNVYVTDTKSNTIRMVTPAGVVTTLAGSPGVRGNANGTGSAASFASPCGIAVNASGILYISDSGNHTIRMVTSAGVVTTLAGSAGNSGNADGTGSAAQFDYPVGVTVNKSGILCIADSYNNIIRKVTAAGVVTTLAGGPVGAGSIDGTGSAAQFRYPHGVAVDGNGNIYAADTDNFTIRKMTPAGVVTTLAGSPGVSGTADGTGSAALFYHPSGVAVDVSGNIYVADSYNHTIRMVTPAGIVTTLAGCPGVSGTVNGTGSAARFCYPNGVAVDASGNIYVAETCNGTIRKIAPSGVVTTLAGSPGVSGTADGTGSAASFCVSPQGIAVDAAGNVYVADSYNHTIRMVTPAGVVTTLAGSPGVSGTADGTGSAALFYYPSGVALDASGNIYVADSYNHTIRRVTSGGVVTTIGGTPGVAGVADGLGSLSLFSSPSGAAVSASGILYIADSGNSRISKVILSASISTNASPSDAGVTSGDGIYLDGTTATVVATANQGQNFVNWTENGTIVSTSAYYSFSVVADRSLIANFQPTPSFATWQALHFSAAQLADLTVSAPLADPSGCGIPNLLEYAFNSSPWVADRSILPVVDSANGYLSLSYIYNKTATDLTYIVEVSSDLVTWNSGSAYTTTPVIISDGGDTQLLKVNDLVPISSSQKRFIRLRVIQAAP